MEHVIFDIINRHCINIVEAAILQFVLSALGHCWKSCVAAQMLLVACAGVLDIPVTIYRGYYTSARILLEL